MLCTHLVELLPTQCESISISCLVLVQVLKPFISALSEAQGSALKPGDQKRLNDHIEAAKKKGYTGYLCINVRQNASQFQSNALIPALTSKTSLIVGVDISVQDKEKRLAESRPLLGYEALGTQGWPVLLPKEHPLVSLLPRSLTFGHLLRDQAALGNEILLQVFGNGMHTSCVGLMLIYMLCGIAPAGIETGLVGNASELQAGTETGLVGNASALRAETGLVVNASALRRDGEEGDST
eukprot:6477778-Amphidinium_carterae.1